jgi:hypothetical protein
VLNRNGIKSLPRLLATILWAKTFF